MIASNYLLLFRIRIDRIETPIISLMCLKEVGIKAIITANLRTLFFTSKSFGPLEIDSVSSFIFIASEQKHEMSYSSQ